MHQDDVNIVHRVFSILLCAQLYLNNKPFVICCIITSFAKDVMFSVAMLYPLVRLSSSVPLFVSNITQNFIYGLQCYFMERSRVVQGRTD